MKLSIILYVLFLATVFPQQKTLPLIKNKQNNVQYQPDFNFTAINQMKCWVSNTNPGAMAQSLGNAIEWPGGRNAFKQLVFYDALQLMGTVAGERRMMVQNNFQITTNIGETIQPGKIFDDGIPANPDNPKYRIYKIQKGWESLPFGKIRDQLERDYNQWPVEDGAPWVDVDGDGFFSRGVDQPQFLGDEVMFFVANDADSSLKLDSDRLPYSKSFNIEFQITTFAKQGTGTLGDVVFRKFKMINKGSKPIEEFYINWYSDVDIGNPGDDAAGIDTSLGLAYTYNYTKEDGTFNDTPPALGYVMVQGPRVEASINDSAYYNGKWQKGYKNLDMINFNFYRGYSDQGRIPDSIFFQDKYYFPLDFDEFEYTIKGKMHTGDPIVNPVTKKETVWPLAGDPVAKTGWYDQNDGWADDTVNVGFSDKYIQFTVAPFTFEPFDTQEVVVATIAAQGTDNINSVSELKRKAQSVRQSYLDGFQSNKLPESPKTHFYTDNEEFTLWWESNAEEYDEYDLFLENQGLYDTTYTFEGYIVEQYSDSLGSDPETVMIYDKVNGITVIEDNEIVNGVSVTVPVIYGSDNGLVRFMNIDTDTYSGGQLLSGQEYYFGVTAYAFSPNSDPTFLKSPTNIEKITPGKPKIDFNSPYSHDQNINSNQIEGLADASVTTKIIDPSSINGDRYEVQFTKKPEGLFYDVVNITSGDTVLANADDYNPTSENKSIYNGFIILVNNFGKDSITVIDDENLSAIKQVLEIRNEEGFLENPREVLGNVSSNGNWKLLGGGSGKSLRENLNWTGSIGFDTYEIRFTEQGSEYYTTGYGLLFFERDNDPKGKGRVPFEIWKVSRDGTEEKRMKIKVYDRELRDSSWTKDEEKNQWEMIYAYDPEVEYNEPLPETSGVLRRDQFNFGQLIIEGEVPKVGAIIRITTFRPLLDGDKFEITLEQAKFTDTETGKQNIDEISVFPNPFFAGNNSADQNYVRFIGLPTKATVRIFTLSGQLIRKLYKDNQKKFIDWDLQNESGSIVSSGMYVAHIDMPGIGSKILKVAVVPSTKFLDTQ